MEEQELKKWLYNYKSRIEKMNFPVETIYYAYCRGILLIINEVLDKIEDQS